MSQHSDPVALNMLSWKSVTEGLISFKGLQAIPSNKKSVDGGASFVKEFLPPPLELEKAACAACRHYIGIDDILIHKSRT